MIDLQAIELTGGVHRLPVRVYYEDTDAAGMVYYANYLRFAERARTEMTRTLGLEHAQILQRDGIFFAVRRCAADFLSPARLDDHLEVVSRILSVGGASLTMQQIIVRCSAELVRLDVRLACMTTTGKPSRMPAHVRERFIPLIANKG